MYTIQDKGDIMLKEVSRKLGDINFVPVYIVMMEHKKYKKEVKRLTERSTVIVHYTGCPMGTIGVTINNPNPTTHRDVHSMLTIMGMKMALHDVFDKAYKCKKEVTEAQLCKMITSAIVGINAQRCRTPASNVPVY